ncbi:MAG: hypothetical protein B6241_02595 [Spirochaetaceae bacterium 4572_59]|nr:MAG: hypothetical protein B6241_02595 [Spirochaetaceae bacterium 4572_59]
MKTKGKNIVGMAIGFSAGLLGWALLELVLSVQHLLPGYRTVLILSGAVTGAAMCAVLASIEGILHKNISKMKREWIWGLIWGAIGGSVGAFMGQFLFVLILPEGFMPDVYRLPYYIARIISWGIMGAFIGTAEGLRARSGIKISAGLISGISAGVLGGFLVESGMMLYPRESWLKLPGFLIIGLGTALLNILIEEKKSSGVFRVLNGAQKGRKYLLNQKRITIGSGKNNDIVIQGDTAIPKTAVLIVRKGKETSVIRQSPNFEMHVNDQSTNEYQLKYEDVIAIGKIQFLYEVR